MMINKRLINTVSETKKSIGLQVVFQWIGLLANITVMASIAYILSKVFTKPLSFVMIMHFIVLIALCIIVRFICAYASTRMSYQSSRVVKTKYRQLILEQMMRLGKSYINSVNTSEAVQVAVEGIDQLETYFGQYLPQLVYALLAPLTLFIVIAPLSFSSALILFICVPLIPVTIIAVQKWAKKLLNKYWSQYTALGDTFLENLQGLTTTKIYQSDAYKHQQMNESSEQFRKITMKVLTMQLNSITIMDIIAYGGAALGMIMATISLKNGSISLFTALFIILVAADFFLPMRLLGSYFHIAMNGMAASDKMLRLLDIPINSCNDSCDISDSKITINDLSFGYDDPRKVLKHISLSINPHEFIGIIGESGCGKSTLANLLSGKLTGYQGSLTFGDVEVNKANPKSLNEMILYIGNNAMLFKGSVRDNLLMANAAANDETLNNALKQVNLYNFLQTENGLDTQVNERGSNFSGGQRQRLALARALLANRLIYIFDEATSNIDSESEADILSVVEQLTQTKTVIFISHRLANVKDANQIYVMDKGSIVQRGTFSQLSNTDGPFKKLWDIQFNIENFLGKEGA